MIHITGEFLREARALYNVNNIDKKHFTHEKAGALYMLFKIETSRQYKRSVDTNVAMTRHIINEYLSTEAA